MSSILAALHLLAFGIGLGAVWVRGRQMRTPLDERRLHALFAADSAWGIAAAIWLGTGLWRLLGGIEKPTSWYLHNPVFHTKMGLFILVLLLELWPMVTLIKWRLRVKKNEPIDPSPLAALRVINTVEMVIVLVMVFVATALARGQGQRVDAAASVACQVKTSFEGACLQCHSAATRQASLDLQSDPHLALVGVPSSQWPSETRVKAGDPEGSLLYAKLTGRQGTHGTPMPQTGKASPEMVALVERWIRDGASRCEH
ncbi:DUF2214 family protein [Pendulispora albinea]|uniref:DUF2214 family protein n=1 Tax=Pendulispora albinea TaxID=2741071 RepID=A0ABZ2M1X3_9BACT